MDFIVAGTKLFAALFGLEDSLSSEELHEILKTVEVPRFQPKKGNTLKKIFCCWSSSPLATAYSFLLSLKVKIQTEPGNEPEPHAHEAEDEEALERLIAHLPDRFSIQIIIVAIYDQQTTRLSKQAHLFSYSIVFFLLFLAGGLFRIGD